MKRKWTIEPEMMAAFNTLRNQPIDRKKLTEGMAMITVGIDPNKGMELFTRERIFWLMTDMIRR